ncbi:LytR/AlgR family response regulator transcription factor [Lacihabitans soyangensis]|uniref:LytTR family transcriptional regulator n=1 Tax=Lacihabitans soyangensis TaxID=869394 RepID=A0AAE3H6E4_9BACT|nr:LytTR family transcriptional regulator [Lacihabitans soyangensis]
MTINLGLTKKIKLSEVLYFKAKSNYTIIYLTKGRQISIPKTLKTFEETLVTTNFFRIDRAYIINLGFVKMLYKSGRNIEVELINKIKIPIARRRRGDFNKFTRRSRIVLPKVIDHKPNIL